MAVIINEFEVVTEPPAERQVGEPGTAEEQQQAPPMAPKDVQEILHRQMERMKRIRAH